MILCGGARGACTTGTKPAYVPAEQLTKFEMVINFQTAKALGLTIPPIMLMRTTRVIK